LLKSEKSIISILVPELAEGNLTKISFCAALFALQRGGAKRKGHLFVPFDKLRDLAVS